MISQEMQQGVNKIRIETAESLEDAKKHNFNPGEYSRYFINGKPAQNYMTLIKFMVAETKNNQAAFIPDKKALIESRKNLLTQQNNMLRDQITEMKNKFSVSGLTEQMLKPLDQMLEKIDEYGMRIAE